MKEFRMRIIWNVFLLVPLMTLAQEIDSRGQDNVFAFYEYKIKDGIGMKGAFNAGYKRDLEWHEAQGDDWSWIGWYVINGERRGRFIDATPDHSWVDFDNWKINGALNGKLNNIHWIPYVETPSGNYRMVLSEYSNSKGGRYKSNILQVHNIEVSIPKEGTFNEFLMSFKRYLEFFLRDIPFVWMKTVSGDGVQNYQLYVCIDRMEQMERVVNIFTQKHMPDKLWRLYTESVTLNQSEMWKYMPDLSLYPED
ncbi:hypothetical protein [Galbibacter pacificus]|uniref:DUF2931 family protein n=1 Tax=Galbibacter pacificus TaxID=2996052 RepID=A0ABT6FQZ0_9FLAO|nr:hypothetical protein [Galbibacter pacificus]MDG3581839.1 hypothetical protein [Galbibacter pacificus]MDG3585687.1 hypothetical protein [Galbibacter pacificus]